MKNNNLFPHIPPDIRSGLVFIIYHLSILEDTLENRNDLKFDKDFLVKKITKHTWSTIH